MKKFRFLSRNRRDYETEPQALYPEPIPSSRELSPETNKSIHEAGDIVFDAMMKIMASINSDENLSYGKYHTAVARSRIASVALLPNLYYPYVIFDREGLSEKLFAYPADQERSVLRYSLGQHDGPNSGRGYAFFASIDLSGDWRALEQWDFSGLSAESGSAETLSGLADSRASPILDSANLVILAAQKMDAVDYAENQFRPD